MACRFCILKLLGLWSVGVFFLLCSYELLSYGFYVYKISYSEVIEVKTVPEIVPNEVATSSIDEVIEKYRIGLRGELVDFRFPTGKSLSSYVPEVGGTPLRSIVVTTWRSGSTFLGELLSSVPGSFYHYEPLLNFGWKKIREVSEAEEAVKNIKDLFNCDYSDLRSYLDYSKNITWGFSSSKRLWSQCELLPEYCYDQSFLDKFCKLFPFHLVKVVRLRLNFVEQLLSDEKLNLRVILLVRDPRGTMQSRSRANWCLRSPDCGEASNLCDDLVADYEAATKLQALYPKQFRTIRYEDLSLNPYENSAKLLEFLQLYMHENVAKFLNTHTIKKIGDAYTTYRDTRNTPFHWRSDMNYTQVKKNENDCELAMQLWGYIPAYNSTSLLNLNPITNYTVVK